MATTTGVLEREREAAKRLLPALMPANKDRWALFAGDGLFAVYDTDDQALKVGYERFGPGNFLAVELCEVDHLRAHHGIKAQ